MAQDQRSIPPSSLNSGTGKREKTTRSRSSRALSETQRARCAAKANALDASKVHRKPTHVRPRIVWMGKLLTLARSDQDRLVKVVLDGEPITAEDIRDAGALVEHFRLSHEEFKRASRAASNPDTGAPEEDSALASMSTEALRDEVRAHHKTLANALTTFYRRDRATLAALREALRQDSDAEILATTEQVLALCDDPKVSAWIANAPRGEGTALARLEALAPVFQQRVEGRTVTPARRALREARDRAWTAARDAVERVRLAGCYLVKGDPTRARDYLQFESLRTGRYRAKKKRAKKPAATPAPSPTPSGEGTPR